MFFNTRVGRGSCSEWQDQVSGIFISFVHFIRQFGVPAFFPPLAIYGQKEKSKTKSAKNQVLFEIFNSHNKKICQISNTWFN